MKKTRTKLGISLVTMLVTLCMLLGSTYAWFTDSVSNTGNRIQAGTLDIDLLMYKQDEGKETYSYQSIDGGVGDIFKEANNANDSTTTLWEPGKTQVVYLAIQNKGNLAFKYQIYLDVIDHGLCNDGSGNSSLVYAIIPMGKDKDVAIAAIPTFTTQYSKWTDITALFDYNDVKPGRISATENGCLDEIAKGEENETEFFALVVHMKEDAGNVYQGKDAIIDVYLTATQQTAEKDGFDSDQYDANTEYAEKADEPITDTVNKTISDGQDTVFISSVTPSDIDGNQTTVTIPESVSSFKDGENSKLVLTATTALVANHKFTVTSGNGAVAGIDLEVTVNGVEVNEFKDENNQPVDVLVETYIAKGLTLGGVTNTVGIEYAGTDGKTQPTFVSYDTSTGKLVFKTNHFSQYVVDADQVAYVEENNTAYKTVGNAIKYGKTIYLLKNTSGESDIYVYNNMTKVIDLNGYNLGFADNSSFDLGYDNTACNLTITGEGKVYQQNSGKYGLVYMRGCSTDNNKKQIITVDKDVEFSNPTHYGIHINGFPYGTVVNFKGKDTSKFGVFSLNGTIQNKTGNICTINLDGATFDGFYLAGFAKLNISNCTINSTGTALNVKSGEIVLRNNTFNITYPAYNFSYVYRDVQSAASAENASLVFENGVAGYAGITKIDIDDSNSINYIGTYEKEWPDVLYYCINDTSADVTVTKNMKVINNQSFAGKIVNCTDNSDGIHVYDLYFTDVDLMKNYTIEQMRAENGWSNSVEITFGTKYIKNGNVWEEYNPID